jgi:hypothetical protein
MDIRKWDWGMYWIDMALDKYRYRALETAVMYIRTL